MARPTIAFLTDFGTRDHYVGAMKGAALSVCPDATLVDITHEIDPQDVLGGALELAASYQYFPTHTVVVAVVDPGVGSSRRGIAVEADGYRFVAPDNGLLTPVVALADARVVELADPRYARPTVSRTFEGRDRFAPAAAWLASGVELAALGPAVRDPVMLDIPPPGVDAAMLRGVVLRVDRFGNLITNIDRCTLDAFARGGTLEASAGGVSAGRLVGTYADAPPATLCALVGSTGFLELALSGGSAAARLGASRGTPVRVTRGD